VGQEVKQSCKDIRSTILGDYMIFIVIYLNLLILKGSIFAPTASSPAARICGLRKRWEKKQNNRIIVK